MGSMKPAIKRSVVVLPQPEGPSRHTSRPCSIVSEIVVATDPPRNVWSALAVQPTPRSPPRRPAASSATASRVLETPNRRSVSATACRHPLLAGKCRLALLHEGCGGPPMKSLLAKALLDQLGAARQVPRGFILLDFADDVLDRLHRQRRRWRRSSRRSSSRKPRARPPARRD